MTEAPTGLSYQTNPAVYSVGTSILPNRPTVGGGPVASYSVSPPLPPGLVLDSTIGVITGIPTTVTPQASYVVIAINDAGATSVSLSITVLAVPPAGLSYGINPAVSHVGEAFADAPTSVGGAVDSYSVAPPLPSGLVLDGSTGRISGSPTSVAATTTYTVTASNSGGFTEARLIITVLGRRSLNAIRSEHTATLLPSGAVLLAGGSEVPSAELYDPAARTFTFTGSLATNRHGHTATLLTDGRVLVVGGLSRATATPLTSAELYDPATGTFSETGRMRGAPYEHSATLLPGGKVLVVGKDTGAELYDPATGTFTATATMPSTSGTATLLPSGKVLLVGGNMAQLFDPVAETFTATGSPITPRRGHTATLLPGGRVLVVGGFHAGSSAIVMDAELYVPGTETFTDAGSTVDGRALAPATSLPGGEVLFAGGGPGYVTPTASAERYDPVTENFTATGRLIARRSRHTATLLSSGRVLIAGGLDASDPVYAAELYDQERGMFEPNVPTP